MLQSLQQTPVILWTLTWVRMATSTICHGRTVCNGITMRFTVFAFPNSPLPRQPQFLPLQLLYQALLQLRFQLPPQPDGDSYGNTNDSIQDCIQPSGYVSNNGDCDDTDSSVNPGTTEICDDGVDNNCDELVDCVDPDCACNNPLCQTTECVDTTFYENSFIKFIYRRELMDSAVIRFCVDKCFCEALKTGPEEIVLWLDECNQIIIPGTSLEYNNSKTRFWVSSTEYALKIDCNEGKLLLHIQGINLDCVSNPIEACVSITDGPCLCAEEEFTERWDRKGRLIKLI
ncbi:MAG: putative metal-binding motif-containing protein, partial [Deltaproteobacteria bacterium]|nr:putative metal-binding motif-containing protein [Deltaproteobacteria bacterium]